MADIRNFQQEREKRTKGQADFRHKLWHYRLSHVYRFLLVIIALVALIVLVVVQYRNHIYTSYEVTHSVDVDMVNGTVHMPLGSHILTYSNDGAHCTDAKGNVLWNQTYQMQDIIVVTNGNVVAIGDYNGREIYILDENKKLGEVSTTMPIRSIAVAQTGRVAVTVADTKVTWVQIYDPDGKWRYEVRTTMEKSGYPIASALSPNGDLLGLACIYVDSGVVMTNVAFYNFGQVGANKSDYYVSGSTYPDTVIPSIRFLDNGTAYAVGDDRLLFYSGTQIPELTNTYFYEEEVQAVYSDENYVGLLFRGNSADARHKLQVFRNTGEKIGDYLFDIEFQHLVFGQDNFVAYGEQGCLIRTLGGVEKFQGEFAKAVQVMLPQGNSYRYLILTNDSIDTIQFK
ncbi:MAG: DUF5711 family protein [bacterium]|nr:DUF5711 family protein [bacterium]MCM1376245.1 DUF5711 family protein [Muribaculum sp.]